MNRFIIAYLATLIFAGIFVVPFSDAAPEQHPFKPGEKMNYVLKYGVIPAGSASLEVYDMEDINGEAAYHFVMTARSNSFIDIFFKVRDRIDSYADAGMHHSLVYNKDQKEGGTRNNIRVNFDWERNVSRYVNFDSDETVIDQLPGTFDPLSVFYFSRLFDFQQTETFEHPITDGEKSMMGILRVIGRERISVPAGVFDTVVLEPDLKNVEGVFSKKQKAKIRLWLTDDEHRLLVQMKSKAIVGSFVAELVSFEGHDGHQVSSLQKIQ